MAELPLQEHHEEYDPEEKPISTPKRPGGIGWVWKVVIFLVLVLGTIQLIFRFYSDEIIGRVLKEVVLIKSDRLYRIEYDQISFDLLGQQLEITDFQLIPNRQRYYDTKTRLWKTKNSVFEVDIPHIKLTGTSVIDLYANNILNIDEFKVTAPNITAYLQKKDSLHRSKRLKINDLHFLIADRLNYLSIKELAVDKASVVLDIPQDNDHEKYLFQNVSLAAINFLIDSVSQQKDQRPFSVEDINLKARYNLIRLPNSPYSLQFEDIEFSTYAASFTVEGLRLTSDEEAQLGKGKFGKRNVADIYIPYMRGTGVDYRSIYFNKDIHIKQIQLKKPEATLYTRKGQKRDPVANAERVYQKLSKLFNSIEIDKILLDRAYLQYNQNQNELFFVDNASGELAHFLIDSITHRERGTFFFIEDADLNIQEYELPLPDRLHTLRSQEIGISTTQNKVFARNLQINCPYAAEQLMQVDTSGNIQSFNVDVPLLELNHFDIKKAFINRELEANSVFLYQPSFSMFTHVADSLPERTSSDSLARIKDLYPYVKKAFNHIYVNDFYIQEGNSTLVRQFGTQKGSIQIDTASVQLKNIRIDRYSRFRENTLLNTRDISIDLSGLNLIRPDSLYDLTIQNFKASQADSCILLQGVHMKPLIDSIDFAHADSLDLPPTFIDFQLRELKLDSIDITKAYYSGDVEIDQLLIHQPIVKLFKHPAYDYEEVSISPHEKLQAFISKNFQTLSLNRIILDSGSVSVVEDQQFTQERMRIDSVGLYLSDLLIDSSTLVMPQVLFIVDSFNVDGRGYHLFLPDSIHQLSADYLHVSSTDKEAFVKNIQLKADSSKLTPTCNRYFAQVPELKLKGFDPKLLYYDKILAADSLLMPAPIIHADLWKTAEKAKQNTFKLNWDELYQLVKPNLQSIEIAAALLDSGLVQVVQKGLGKGQTLAMEEFRVLVNDFQLDEQAKPTANRLFYADDVQVSSKNFYHFLPDSTYTIHFGEIGFAAKKGNLWGLQINVHPLHQPSSENYVNAYIPEVQLEGIKLFQLYKNQGIDVDVLSISSPWVKGTSFPKAKTQEFSLDDIYPIISKFTPSLRLREIHLAKGDFYLDAYTQLKPDKHHLGKVHLNVTNFLVDSTSSTKKKQFLADAVKFRLTDYELLLPDSLNKLSFKELRVNSISKAAYIDSLRLEPIFPKYQYAQKVGHETDHLTILISKGFLKNVDLRKLMAGTAFDAQKLIIRNFDVNAFRNKNAGLPEPLNRYPKLPRQLLLGTDFPIDLDTLELRDAKVTYEEHAANKDTLGYITLNDMNVTVQNITNSPQKIADGASIAISGNFKIMDEGKVNVFFDMPLNSKEGEYYLEGILDSMNLTCMNPMLLPVASLKITQGYARQARFKVRGNNKFATGIMWFKYKRLRISLLKKKHKSTIGTFFANTFVVIRNNPRRLIVRKGRIFFKRDSTRAVFNYWANTLLSGVKHSIGLRTKTEKPDKEAKKQMLRQVVERFKLEGLAERKAEKERKKKLREQLKKRRKEGNKNKTPDDDLEPDKNKASENPETVESARQSK
ncbi:MAG: hypothetical protein ACPGJS_01915 [Flammeovirgaceae bacterium]